MGVKKTLVSTAIALGAMSDPKFPTKKMQDRDQWKRDRMKKKKAKRDKRKNRK